MLTDSEPVLRARLKQPIGLMSAGRRRLVLVAVVLWPALALAAIGVPPASKENGIDEFIYVGVVERLGDYVARWPRSYYPYRFGYIVPEMLAERTLGPTAGYLALRLGVLGLLSIAFWRAGGRRLAPTLTGSAILVFSPILHRGVFDTYVDSTGVLFLLLGVALLAPLDASPGQWRFAAIAGVALTLSWNSQFVILPLVVTICLVFAVDWVVELRWKSMRALLASSGAIGAAGAVTMAAAVASYAYRFGVWDIIGPNLLQAGQETAEVFIDQGIGFFGWRQYLLVAPLSVAAGVIAWRTEPDVGTRRTIRRMTLFAACSLATFAYFQWGRDTPLISVFLYSVYPLCVALAAMGMALSAVGRRLEPSRQWPAAAGAAALYLIFLSGAVAVGDQFRAVVSFAGACLLVAVVLAVRSSRRFGPLGIWISLMPLVAATGLVTVSSPHVFWGDEEVAHWDPRYDSFVFSYDTSGLDTYNVAREFARSLPALPEERGELRVWFDGTGPTHAATATLLHFTSALQLPGQEGLPTMNDFVLLRLANDRPRFVVLLDPDAADIETALSEISDLGEPYEIRWRRELRSGDQHANVVLLERADGWLDAPCFGPDGNPIIC